MGRLEQGSFEDINNFISKGYEPIGTLNFVLKKHRELLMGNILTLYIDDEMHIIDIQAIYEENPFPRLINYMK